ncbi:Vegetative incompatibility protein HET-E-1, partial [Tetrabaena socialis]
MRCAQCWQRLGCRSLPTTGVDDLHRKTWMPLLLLPAHLQGHTDVISGCVWSPCGRFLASSSKDNTVRVTDAASGTCIAILEVRVPSSGHRRLVPRCRSLTEIYCEQLRGHQYATSVTWSPDGRIIASGSGDKLIRLWSTASGEWGVDAGKPTCFVELQ